MCAVALGPLRPPPEATCCLHGSEMAWPARGVQGPPRLWGIGGLAGTWLSRTAGHLFALSFHRDAIFVQRWNFILAAQGQFRSLLGAHPPSDRCVRSSSWRGGSPWRSHGIWSRRCAEHFRGLNGSGALSSVGGDIPELGK